VAKNGPFIRGCLAPLSEFPEVPEFPHSIWFYFTCTAEWVEFTGTSRFL